MSDITREQVLEYDKSFNQHPWLTGNIDPIPVERADGIYFWDYNGKRYCDMSSQLANVNLGYGNKDIIEAIQSQVEILPYIAPAYASGPRAELAKELISLAPDNMGKVFLPAAARTRMRRLFMLREPLPEKARYFHVTEAITARHSVPEIFPAIREDLLLKRLPQRDF